MRFMRLDIPIVEAVVDVVSVVDVVFDAPALALKLLAEVETRADEHVTYYATLPPYRLIVILRNGLSLADLSLNDLVDVSLGWHPARNEPWTDKTHSPFVLPANRGRRHSKLTIRSVRPPHDGEDILLSAVLDQSPRDQVSKRVVLSLTERRHKKWVELGGQKWLYWYLDHLLVEE